LLRKSVERKKQNACDERKKKKKALLCHFSDLVTPRYIDAPLEKPLLFLQIITAICLTNI